MHLCVRRIVAQSYRHGHYTLVKMPHGERARLWRTLSQVAQSPHVTPAYNSFGNGSAMRVAAAGFMATTSSECIDLAISTAMPTHNHPEGIKGAVATALAIFYGMQSKGKTFIREKVLDVYYPQWSGCLYKDIQPDYRFDETCQITVPAALICFLESNDYTSCIKLAIALGGDADTLAAIAGPIAYAHYKYILLSAKHSVLHPNSLTHCSLDDFMLVTSPLFVFCYPWR